MTEAPAIVARRSEGVDAAPETRWSPGPEAGQRRRRLTVRFAGGVAAQGSLALGSFVLQLLAARMLGLEGLGRYAALYALIVLSTAISQGLVGDSLTVLDRSHSRIRAGLQALAGTLALGLGLVAAVGTWASSFLTATEAAVFGTATALFLLQDVLRRLLMATLRFWHLVLVDVVGTSAAISVIIIVGSVTGGISLLTLWCALAVGQLLSLVLAAWLLPAGERWLAPLRGADLRSVFGYGGWRVVHHSIRPGSRAVMRLLCVALVGLVAVGELEAARIYMAPAMLVVAGITSVLFAGYATQGEVSLQQMVRRADRTVLLITAAVMVVGVLAVLALPVLGPVLTGGAYVISTPMVIGWAGYAAAVAMGSPYGELAAVRGRQRVVMAIRIGESLVILLAVAGLLMIKDSVLWVPLLMAGGALLGALVVRTLVLRPMVLRPMVLRPGLRSKEEDARIRSREDR